jgi:hypothetical protein
MEGNTNTQPNELDMLLASLGSNDNQEQPAAADGADVTTDSDSAEGVTQSQDAGTAKGSQQAAANADAESNNITEESLNDHGDAKTNKAFAQMRTQNKAYNTVMQQMLTRMGVDPTLASDPQKLQKLLEQAEVTQQAKNMQVPAELLQRVVQLENANRAQETQRLQENALRGFKHVRDTYGLTDKELSDFARQLQEAGTNPFEKEMDLDMAYRTHNLQKIIDKATQKAVQEALSKQESAAQRSTAPNKTTGKPGSAKLGDDEINTMAQFDRLLSSI